MKKMNNQRGILAVISGFSGAGKGTVVGELLKTYKDDYCLSVSATTRAPRKDEIHGQHYFFLEREVFEQRIRQDMFLEYARYVDNYYGTPADFVFEKLDKGISVILEIEMQGALKVKERYPETLLLFVTPPTAAELEERLRGRGTEDEATIASRLSRASEEAGYMDKYDYIVCNETGKVKECASKIHHMIESEKKRPDYNQSFIAEMKAGLSRYHKGGE